MAAVGHHEVMAMRVDREWLNLVFPAYFERVK